MEVNLDKRTVFYVLAMASAGFLAVMALRECVEQDITAAHDYAPPRREPVYGVPADFDPVAGQLAQETRAHADAGSSLDGGAP
jgi:hypothetical protein